MPPLQHDVVPASGPGHRFPAPSRRTLTRRQRLVRGWTLSGIGVLGGSFSHALAAGHAPAPVVVLLCWSLSALVCMGLVGIRLRSVSTALGLGLAQGMLHAVLAVAGRAQVEQAPDAAAHAAHWGHHAMTVHVGTAACAHGPGMALLHCLAALLTWAAVRRGDAAAAALYAVVAAVGHTVVLLVRGPRPVLPEAAPSALVHTAVATLNSLVLVGPAPTRGPPALPQFA